MMDVLDGRRLVDTSILASTLDGQPVRVKTSSVRCLIRNEAAPSKTILLLDGAEVVVDEKYESLMAQFAAAWPHHNL